MPEPYQGAPARPHIADDLQVGQSEISSYVQRIQRGELIGGTSLVRLQPATEDGLRLADALAGLEWAEPAACAGALDRAEEFSAVQIGSVPPAAAIRVAREFCRRCPVIDECGADADEHLARGVWGGAFRAGTKPATYRVTPLIPGAPPYRPATAVVTTPAAVASPPTTSKEPAA